MKTMLIAITVCALTTGSAIAAPTTGKATDTEKSAAASEKKADTKRYCITETLTGSRMPQKTCNTRAEWAAQGVDLDGSGK